MAEIQEQMDVAAEISTAIAQPIGDPYAADDDLEAELEKLEQEDLEEKMSAIESTVGLASPNRVAAPTVAAKTASTSSSAAAVAKSPAVPSADPHDEAAQLAALEAEMAM